MKAGPIFLPLVVGDQERRAVIGRFGRAAIAQTNMGRDRLPDTLQRHRAGHVEMPGEKVVAPRRIHHAAAGFPGGVQRFLERGRVINLAITLGTEIADRIEVGIRGGGEE